MSNTLDERAEKWADWLAFHPDESADNVSLQTLICDLRAELAALREQNSNAFCPTHRKAYSDEVQEPCAVCTIDRLGRELAQARELLARCRDQLELCVDIPIDTLGNKSSATRKVFEDTRAFLNPRRDEGKR